MASVTSSASTSHVTRGPVTFERLCWLLVDDDGGGRDWGGLVGLGWEGSGRP